MPNVDSQHLPWILTFPAEIIIVCYYYRWSARVQSAKVVRPIPIIYMVDVNLRPTTNGTQAMGPLRVCQQLYTAQESLALPWPATGYPHPCAS